MESCLNPVSVGKSICFDEGKPVSLHNPLLQCSEYSKPCIALPHVSKPCVGHDADERVMAKPEFHWNWSA